MKVTIKGEMTLPVLGEAYMTALKHAKFDSQEQMIRGATVFFNIYDRKTGDLVQVVNEQGMVVDAVVWLTPEERYKQQLPAQRKKAKRQKISA